MSNAMDRMSSMLIWQTARRFLEGALILRREKEDIFSPTYFLVGQAIELALKAFLRGDGAAEDFLKGKLGHNLSKALSTAEDKGLTGLVPISEQDRACIAALNAPYQSKDLQYAKQGFKSWPAIDDLLAIADRLVKGLRAYCEASREKHWGKPTAIE